MTDSSPQPVEERLADRVSGRHVGIQRGLRLVGQLDRVAYRAVAELSTPLLDRPLRWVSDFADFSKPWFLAAGVLAAFGGARGRRAAVTGLAAIGLNSLLVNQSMKRAGARRRPNRAQLGVPENRWVRMPLSTSFPSGHSASAAAFAVSVGRLLPGLRLPLRVAAGIVAFSRIYTGVHYPGDVVVGTALGTIVGRATSAVVQRLRASSADQRASS
ncbi:MAG TPA: phosphatase PAP2 family protein [Propionibacteriaceae bacterium]